MLPVVDAISGFFAGVVKPVLDKFVPDAKDRLEAENLLLTGMMASDLAQMEVNKVEAAHQSIFVAGWRPAIGWICGAAYAYTFVVQPFLVFGLTVFGLQLNTAQIPKIDMGELSMVLLGILGLGTMRTYEKTVAKPP